MEELQWSRNSVVLADGSYYFYLVIGLLASKAFIGNEIINGKKIPEKMIVKVRLYMIEVAARRKNKE